MLYQYIRDKVDSNINNKKLFINSEPLALQIQSIEIYF
jgi:hypothetical protein